MRHREPFHLDPIPTAPAPPLESHPRLPDAPGRVRIAPARVPHPRHRALGQVGALAVRDLDGAGARAGGMSAEEGRGVVLVLGLRGGGFAGGVVVGGEWVGFGSRIRHSFTDGRNLLLNRQIMTTWQRRLEREVAYFRLQLS